MKLVKTIQLEVGMITAKPVKTKHGQLIVSEDTPLTDQLIARISFYGIDHIYVEGEEEVPSKPAEKGNVQAPTYSQRIKGSQLFQNFQFDYTMTIGKIKSSFDPLLAEDHRFFDKQEALDMVMPLLSQLHNSIEMFDMLHNMRAVDDSVYAHSLNVALIARMLGRWLKLPKDDLNLLVIAGILHDIGKTQIPEEILNKPGKYTKEEFDLVKQHPVIGFEILNRLPAGVINTKVKKATLQHHERCDGTGYPQQLKSKDIDPLSQIIAIADVYDAMTAARSYRQPLCPFQVIAAFEDDGLTKYDPKIILTFLEHIATTYQSNRVLLNDGRAGDIVLLNKHALSRPIVRVSKEECVDLSHEPELYIQSLL